MNVIIWITKFIPLIFLIYADMTLSETYNFDNISLLHNNGERWFPIMGEIHFSRYPKKFWYESLMKMKEGGVDIVSTYVFWIHHEEIENEYDFTGDRDLRTFVKACKDVGLKLWLRIGPWAHGEARNGGFPDWLLKKEFVPRTNDKRYFSVVQKWYKKIYEKVEGFLYSEENKDNPIIGIQIENEYGHVGGLSDETGEIHMEKLTEIAKEIGFIVPFSILFSILYWSFVIEFSLLILFKSFVLIHLLLSKLLLFSFLVRIIGFLSLLLLFNNRLKKPFFSNFSSAFINASFLLA